MSMYGIAKSGPHTGERTICKAKDPATCPYHTDGSHEEMSREEADLWNEKILATKNAHKMGNLSKIRAKTKPFHARLSASASMVSRLKKTAATLLAITALSSLAACGSTTPPQYTIPPQESTSQSQQAYPNDDENDDGSLTYDEAAAKAKYKWQQFQNSDTYKNGKAKAGKLADKAKNYVESGDAANDIKSLVNSLATYGIGGSIGDVNSSSQTTGVYANISKEQALQELSSLRIQEADSSNYDRNQWKHWVATIDAPGGASTGRRPCFDVRSQVLARQGQDVRLSNDGCTVESGSYTDPYSGATGLDKDQVQIDHSVPLGYAARHGGQAWSAQKKQDYANDLSQGHLVAVYGKENIEKSDKGPSEWMPDKDQCGYAKNFADVLFEWKLSTSKADYDVMQNVIRQCAA